MKRTSLFILVAMLIALQASEATISRTLSYQGVLRDDTGSLLSGVYDLTFRLYIENHAGQHDQIWQEVHSQVLVEQGVFDVILGSIEPIDHTFGVDTWIGIQINSDPELDPHIPLTAAPFSFRAALADSAVTAGTVGDPGWIIEGEDMYSSVAGNVGIGVDDPESKLSVRGASPTTVHEGQLRIEGSETTGAAGTGAGITLGGHDGTTRRTWATIRALKENDTVGDVGGHLSLATRRSNGGGPYERVRITSEGSVGIGHEDPAGRLHVRDEDLNLPSDAIDNDDVVIEDNDAILGLYSNQGGTAGSGIVLGSLDNGVFQNKWSIIRGTPGGQNSLRFTYGSGTSYWNNDVMLYLSNDGKLGIGTGTASPQEALTVRGNILVLSQSTGDPILELGEGLDYAEGFDVAGADNVAPGTVLVIDSAHPGELAVSTHAYDSKVAGIVAGANELGSGVRLGAGQYDQDVALAGRVYCKVDASHGAVEPGDLLTTAPTAGHAMKVSDPARAQGAILGKAMEALPEGRRGVILVLVTLQ